MKKVVFNIPYDLFKQAKIATINKDMNMTQYIIGLISRDLAESKGR